MPKIQMENLTGNFLRRMMIGPRCYFIRVSSLAHKWGSHRPELHLLFQLLLLPAALAVLCRKAARFSCEHTAAASMRSLQCYAKPCDMWLSSAPTQFQLAQLLYHPSSGENSVLRLNENMILKAFVMMEAEESLWTSWPETRLSSRTS